MSSLLSPFGERSTTLVAACFDTRASAELAAAGLNKASEGGEKVYLILPNDAHAAEKLEPESRGIVRTLWRSHLLFGVFATLIGAGAGLGLVALPWPAAASSPGFAVLFSAVFGLFAGLMLAGLVSLRPDHGYVIDKVMQAVRRGRWAVVMHPLNRVRARVAAQALEATGAHPLLSL